MRTGFSSFPPTSHTQTQVRQPSAAQPTSGLWTPAEAGGGYSATEAVQPPELPKTKKRGRVDVGQKSIPNVDGTASRPKKTLLQAYSFSIGRKTESNILRNENDVFKLDRRTDGTQVLEWKEKPKRKYTHIKEEESETPAPAPAKIETDARIAALMEKIKATQRFEKKLRQEIKRVKEEQQKIAEDQAALKAFLRDPYCDMKQAAATLDEIFGEYVLEEQAAACASGDITAPPEGFSKIFHQ